MREDLSEIVALRRCIQRRNSQVALILALVLISLSACLMPQTSRAHVGNQTHMQPGHSEHQIGRFFERNSEHIHEPLLSVRSLTSRTLRGGGLTGKPVTDSLRGDSLIGRERTGRVLAYRGGAAGVANSSSADARGRVVVELFYRPGQELTEDTIEFVRAAKTFYPQFAFKFTDVGASNASLPDRLSGTPTVTVREGDNVLHWIEGWKPREITNALETISLSAKEHGLRDELHRLVSSEKVMLFMKGDKTNPRCHFSSGAVRILQSAGIEFGTYDILSNETVRAGLKEEFKWPTYPQLYVKGELVGGFDILKALDETDQLKDEIGRLLKAEEE